ncbi:MAG: nucleotidyltransferase family protein [Dehalococcoidia bacterium]
MTCATVPASGLCEQTHEALKTMMRCIIPSMFRAQQPWAVVGSTASVLQGLPDYQPPDVDLATTMEGAFIMEGCLAEAGEVIRPLGYSVSAPYASYFGIFRVGGVKVEVMGALIIRCADGVIDLADHFARWSDEVRVREVDGMHIPLAPLEWQLVANALLGRGERVEGLARYLLAAGYDRRLVSELLADERIGARTTARVREALHVDG